MELRKKIAALLTTFFIAVPALLSACAVQRMNIYYKDSYPDCYVGEQYDVFDLIEQEEGVSYLVTAYQTNGEQKVYLDCNENKITPQKTGLVYIKFTLQKDKKTSSSKLITLTVLERTTIPDDDDDDDEGNITVKDSFDLSESPLIYSLATDNYGAEATLLQQKSAILGDILRVTIPDRSQYSTGYGNNYEVWSWLCLPLNSLYQTDFVDLTERYLSFRMNFLNASQTISFILEDERGTFSQERVIYVGSENNNTYSYYKLLPNGWYQVYIIFSTLNNQTFSGREYADGTNFDITRCKTVLITTSNAGKITTDSSHTYFDKMYLTDEISDDSVVFSNAEFYPPNPDFATQTDVLFIGNSFIYSSDIGAILQGIADENDKPLKIESYSLGNGNAAQLYQIALSQFENSRQNTWGYKLFTGGYDILFLQAVFDYTYGAMDFYASLCQLNIDTKIILLPADNEGTTPENFYLANGDFFGLINWRGLILELKNHRGLTQWDLNQAADDWHANALSGYTAAVMIYYSFYNQMPAALSLTHSKLMAGYYISGSSIAPYTFNMRGTNQDVIDRLTAIRNAAKQIIDTYHSFYLL